MNVAETQRLLISKFTLNDASFFLELVNTPNWLKYIGDRNTKTKQDAEKRIEEGHLASYKEYGFGFYKLLLKDENRKPIGSCGLIKRAGALRPAVSGRSQRRFIHCMAPPAAPLTRLSMAAITTTVSPSVATLI